MCLLYSLFFHRSIFRTFILSSSAIFRKTCNVFVHFSPRLSLNNGRHKGFPEFNICFPDLHDSDGLEMWPNPNDFPLFSIRPFHCSGVLCCIDNHLEKTLVKAWWVWWYETWKDAMLLKMRTYQGLNTPSLQQERGKNLGRCPGIGTRTLWACLGNTSGTDHFLVLEHQYEYMKHEIS